MIFAYCVFGMHAIFLIRYFLLLAHQGKYPAIVWCFRSYDSFQKLIALCMEN